MSAALVEKSLALVDSDFREHVSAKNKRNRNNVFNLMPERQRATKNIRKNGRKEKVDLLSKTKKLTVLEARKCVKSKKTILKENLKKIKEIEKASRIELDKETTRQIIERAVTKRPIKILKLKTRKEKKTAFTEEDFKKFEDEYFG